MGKKNYSREAREKKNDKYKHTNNVHVVKLGVYCANYSEKVQPEAIEL